MSSMKSTINSVKTICKNLNKRGFETEINPVYMGSYQGSYVELDITKTINKDGEYTEYYTSVRFIANGYEGYSDREFGTAKGLKVAKQNFYAYLDKDLGLSI